MASDSHDGRSTRSPSADGADGVAGPTDRGERSTDRTDRRADEYEAHLERSRRVWDRWSDWYTLSERDFEPMREAAIDRLELSAGDRVLDVGCGPGVNFAPIREAVGETGAVVGVDYSPEMVAKARERIDEHGWENVSVRLADATRVEFDERFDAVVATLSLSVMPDVRSTVTHVHDLLRTGGELAVIDLRTIPSGPARIADPLLWRFLCWYANWNPDGDTLAALEATFEECEVVDTSLAGVAFTAHCRTSESAVSGE